MQKTDFKIQRPISTLKQQVAEKLRAAIFEMHFVPGDRLIERELCELLGVSRTLVREALIQLEGEGLVQMIPHKGPVVSIYTQDEIKGIYETRAALEELAGRAFTQRSSEKEKKALEKTLQEVKNAYKKEDPSGWLTAKSKFYAVLLEGSRNPSLSEMLRIIHGRVSMFRATTISQPGRHKESYEELVQIVQAIKSGDHDAAGSACRKHVERASDVALKTLSEKEADKSLK